MKALQPEVRYFDPSTALEGSKGQAHTINELIKKLALQIFLSRKILAASNAV